MEFGYNLKVLACRYIGRGFLEKELVARWALVLTAALGGRYRHPNSPSKTCPDSCSIAPMRIVDAEYRLWVVYNGLNACGEVPEVRTYSKKGVNCDLAEFNTELDIQTKMNISSWFVEIQLGVAGPSGTCRNLPG